MKNFKFNHFLIIILICLFAYLLICLLPPQVHAQSTSFTISPPRNEITLSPGQSYTNDIQVTNNNDTPIAVSANVNDFIVSDQNGTPQPVTDNSSQFSLQSWISLSNKELRIAPRTSDILSYTIAVPKNALPGGHYSLITFSPIQKGTENISVSYQIASLIIVSIPGNIIEKAKIVNPQIKYDWQKDKVDLKTTIKNLGDIHIKPILYVSISSTFGEFVGTRILPMNNIFPGASRIYIQELQVPWWLPGKYTLRFFGLYGDNNNHFLSYEYSFWAIPEKILIIALGLFGILGILGIIVIRNHANKIPTELNKKEIRENI